MLKATTVQSNAIKLLFEALKDVINETTLMFDETGLKISTMDLKRVALIHVVLEAEQFDVYEIDRPVVLGVNVLNLHKLVKSVSTHDSITFQVDGDSNNEFSILFCNTDKHTETVYKIKTLDLPKEDITIPDVDMEVALAVRAVDFQKIIREMVLLAEDATIEAVDERLRISCEGEYAMRTTEIQRNEHGLVFVKASDAPISGTFSLKYLQLFTKATNLSHTVDLFLKDSFPLILRYNVLNLGELRFILAPKVTDA